MTREKIIKIISEQFNVEEENLNEETSFRDELDADSLDLVELIMALEDEFELEIEDDEIDSIQTIGDALDFIKRNEEK